MPFSIEDFVRLRPFAYHVTSRDNLDLLRSSRRLRTAASLIRAAERHDLVGCRRAVEVALDTPYGRIVLKDQRPLIAANLELAPGWTLAEFVEYLNGFTYFWPGRERGPIGPGERLLARYEVEGPVVLRVPMIELFAANEQVSPEFCAFNSGAPRYHSGKPARRGPNLFTTADRFSRGAAEVVELAFRGDVILPPSTVVRAGSDWVRLFGGASS